MLKNGLSCLIIQHSYAPNYSTFKCICTFPFVITYVIHIAICIKIKILQCQFLTIFCIHSGCVRKQWLYMFCMCQGFCLALEGHLLCKIHFFMSFIHKHVSPLCKEILEVSGKNICSLFCLDPKYIKTIKTCLNPPTLSPESPLGAPLCSF